MNGCVWNISLGITSSLRPLANWSIMPWYFGCMFEQSFFSDLCDFSGAVAIDKNSSFRVENCFWSEKCLPNVYRVNFRQNFRLRERIILRCIQWNNWRLITHNRWWRLSMFSKHIGVIRAARIARSFDDANINVVQFALARTLELFISWNETVRDFNYEILTSFTDIWAR